MERQIKIIVNNTDQLKERVINFFEKFGFQLADNKSDILKFKTKSSLWDTWKTNPLKWGSEISVSIYHNSVQTNFCVDTDAQMKTKEEEAVWRAFIDNFESYLINDGKPSTDKLTSTLLENKKSRLTYFCWTIFGALIGGLLGFLYYKSTGNNSILITFLIPVFATLFLKWRINYVKAKNAI